MTKIVVDITGWLGAALLLAAYGLVSFKKILPEAGRYQFFNAVGSCCLIVNTMYYRAYPSALVNVVWIVIAISATYRLRHATAS